MNTKRIRMVAIFAIVAMLALTLSSCGKQGYNTKYAEASSTEKEAYQTAVDWVELQIATIKIEVALQDSSLTAEECNQLENLKAKIKVALTDHDKTKDYSSDINEVNALCQTTQEQNEVKTKVLELMENFVNYERVSGKESKEDQDKNYKVNLIKADIERYRSAVSNATSFNLLTTGVATVDSEGNAITLEGNTKTLEERRAEFEQALTVKSGCALFGSGSVTNRKAEELSNKNKENPYTNISEIVTTFVIDVDIRLVEQEPLHFTLTSFGEFFTNFFNNFFVFPVGWLLYILSKLFGGWYILGLFLATLIVRTLGWPIYAKTNDMSLKMQVIQPQMQAIEEKYANRKDPDSQRMKQAEQAQLYRKNKIGLGGCIMPFLQFPIFMAIYGAIRRLPYTVATEGSLFTLNWANELKSTLFGIPFDLYEDYTASTGQLIGIIVLVILVSGTQFLSQKLSENRQKHNQEKSQEDIPAYRRQAYKQTNNQSQNTMKYVMYMMIFMMATFVFTSKAGLGIYWLIGNLYSMVQTLINNKMGLKKLEKMKAQEKAKKDYIVINKNSNKR